MVSQPMTDLIRFLLISDWCAKIYQHAAYSQTAHGGGWEKVIQETSMLDLIGNKNNDVSSVRVHPGCTLKLFNEHNNVGLLDSLTANVTFLSAYNDRVSSLSCTCQGMIFRTLKTDSKKVTLNLPYSSMSPQISICLPQWRLLLQHKRGKTS